MPYILIAVGAAGIFCGCRFKAAALVAFSVLIFLTMIPVSLLASWSIGQAALMVFLLLAVFQAGYLGGLFWCFALPRAIASFRQARETKSQGALKDAAQALSALFHGHRHPVNLAAMGGPVKPDDDGAN